MKRIKKLKNLPDSTVYDELDSPIGCLTILASSQGLHGILWDIERSSVECKQTLASFKQSASDNIILKAKQQLTEYFLGSRTTFTIPLVIDGTPFQIQAWNQLSLIPYGKTITYGEQAKAIGDKNKARAIGLANGLNPISIIIPCHRVIGSNGNLTGFGGGIEKKEFLIQLEKRRGGTNESNNV